jgi:hypothetical protein
LSSKKAAKAVIHGEDVSLAGSETSL